jgi:hypothetical protein
MMRAPVGPRINSSVLCGSALRSGSGARREHVRRAEIAPNMAEDGFQIVGECDFETVMDQEEST